MNALKDLPGGTLFVVGTPIGNVADLGARAGEILSQVDLIAAEDTRHTRALLTRIGAKTRLIAYHDHNEAQAAPATLDQPTEKRFSALSQSL